MQYSSVPNSQTRLTPRKNVVFGRSEFFQKRLPQAHTHDAFQDERDEADQHMRLDTAW